MAALPGTLRDELLNVKTNYPEAYREIRGIFAEDLNEQERVRAERERLRLGEELSIRPPPPEGKIDFGGVFVGNDRPGWARTVASMSAGGIEGRNITTALFSGGGKLPIDVSDTFIDNIIAHQPTLQSVATRRMMGPIGRVDELIVAPESTRLAVEGTDISESNSVSIASRDLETVEVGWAADITLSFLEDNIEKANAEQHIANALARQFSNDLEQLFWRGDEDSGDAFISINDGILDLAGADGSVNDYDATGDTSAVEVLADMYDAFPPKYRDATDLAFYVPHELARTYADELASRETGLGDSVFFDGRRNLRWFGIPLIPTTALTAAGAKALLSRRSNLLIAFQRNITVDSEWRPRKRVVEYTLTARFDVQYATSDLIVLASGIPSGLL